MVVFNWLHLTDLHWGMRDLEHLWPNIEEDFFNDLEFLIKEVGSIDLVLFTGDIVQSGDLDKFERVNQVIEGLWNRFRTIGSDPKFLVVPGNHDLVRPKDLQDPALMTLMYLWDKSEVQESFWDKVKSPQRKVVSKAFTNYVEWLRNTPVQKVEDYKEGILPGDFSATFKKEGAKLGVVGLNSAFLHLTDDVKSKLALNVRQFNAACGGNGPQWIKKHDVCLLLTHHSMDWLTKEAQNDLNGEIHSPPERFALHLFGHMHEAELRILSLGGANARCRLQGCSLFSMEGWGDKKQKRMHGYSLGQLKIDGDNAELRIWPRKAMEKQGGGWQFERDLNFLLPRGEDGTEPIPVKLLRPAEKPSDTKHKDWKEENFSCLIKEEFCEILKDREVYQEAAIWLKNNKEVLINQAVDDVLEEYKRLGKPFRFLGSEKKIEKFRCVINEHLYRIWVHLTAQTNDLTDNLLKDLQNKPRIIYPEFYKKAFESIKEQITRAKNQEKNNVLSYPGDKEIQLLLDLIDFLLKRYS